MNDPRQAAFDAILRSHFPYFLMKAFHEVSPGAFEANWHHEAIAYELDRCASGESKRLIINIQPRSLKSLIVSVAWPAFMLGRDPTLRFVCVSYAESLAFDSARHFRQVMESSWYRRVFPARLVNPTSLDHLRTTAGGQRLSVGLGGSLTGRGGNIIILDDPMKPSEAYSECERETVKRYFDGTLFPRLDSKRDGMIIMIMQRLHDDDLTGHLLRQGGWNQLKLASIATEYERIPLLDGKYHERKPAELLHEARESQEVLDEVRRKMGSREFEAQYQQEPLPAGGNMIRREWLQYYDTLPGETA